ncbi:MAG: HD domain-containing protein [Armatimonadetes bacterium]|nr:HD domain-containing protein [Armatimonadota bacterium]
MKTTKIQVFLIGAVSTGGVGVVIAFALRQLPPLAAAAIAIAFGLAAGGLAAAMLRDPTQPLHEALRTFRKQEYRAPIQLGNTNPLEQELTEVLTEMSTTIQASQEEFQRKSRDLNFFIDFSKLMTTAPSEGKILPLVLDRVVHHVGARSASILLLGSNGDELVARAVRGGDDSLAMGQRVSATEGVYSQVLQTKKPVIQRKGVRDRTLSRISPQGPNEDLACIPIQIESRLLGVLNAGGKKDDTGFTHADSEFLTFLANGTAMVLKQASLQSHLTAIFLSIVKAMVQAMDARDRYTRNHSTRVSEYSMALARALRYEPDQLDGMLFGSLLHDIGKLGVPDDILNKPGKLSVEEFEVIKSHPVRGAEILAHLETQLPWNILPMVRHHHERWDGRGYPDGLHGENIQYNARVVALADFFDAVTSDRVYRPGMPLKQAIMEIRRGIATHFDPKLLPVATEVLELEYKRIVETIGLG